MLFKPDILLFGYNEIDSEASKDIDELTPELTGMQTLRFKMNDDLMNKDLKKKKQGRFILVSRSAGCKIR